MKRCPPGFYDDAPRGPARSCRGGVTVGAVLALLGCLAVTSCADKTRMGEGETQRFKREALQEHHREISPLQAQFFLMHPARTRGELEDVLDRFIELHSEHRGAEQFLLREGRVLGSRTSLRSRQDGRKRPDFFPVDSDKKTKKEEKDDRGAIEEVDGLRQRVNRTPFR